MLVTAKYILDHTGTLGERGAETWRILHDPLNLISGSRTKIGAEDERRECDQQTKAMTSRPICGFASGLFLWGKSDASAKLILAWLYAGVTNNLLLLFYPPELLVPHQKD